MRDLGFKNISIGKLIPNNNLSRKYPKVFTGKMRKIRNKRNKNSEEECRRDDLFFSSIKIFGILHNLVVRPIKNSDCFEVICGNRRLAKALEAGKKKLRCKIIECDDSEALWISLVENDAREELDPIQKAFSLKRLKDFYEQLFPDTKQGGDQSKRSHPSFVEFYTKEKGVGKDYVYDRLKLFEVCSKIGKTDFGLPATTVRLIEEKTETIEEFNEIANFAKENKMTRDQVEELIEIKKETNVNLQHLIYPLKDFILPKALLKDFWVSSGKIQKILQSNFSYLSNDDKEKLKHGLKEFKPVVDKAISKLEVMTHIFIVDSLKLKMTNVFDWV